MRRLAMMCLAAGVLVPLAAAGPGCVRVAATGQREFILLSWEQEINLGRKAAPELEDKYGARLDNLPIQAYVRTVGDRVARSARHAGMPELPYRFTVLESDVVNALALPGGPVYVTRGLLARLTTEGQLAAVLGHEIAHVNARHASQQISRQMGFEVLLAAASAAAGRSEKGAQVARHAGDLAKVIVGLVNLKYSRGMESEADRLGLDYMAAAGYKPQEMLNLLNALARTEGRRPPEFLSTHPNPESRVGAVDRIVRTKYPNRGGRVADEEYRREVLNRLRGG